MGLPVVPKYVHAPIFTEVIISFNLKVDTRTVAVRHVYCGTITERHYFSTVHLFPW